MGNNYILTHDFIEVLRLKITNFVPKVPSLSKKLNMILQILSTLPLHVLDQQQQNYFQQIWKKKINNLKNKTFAFPNKPKKKI